METVDVLLRVGGFLVVVLGGLVAAYSARAGKKATDTTTSLTKQQTEWVQIRETNAMLILRSEACEERERLMAARIEVLEGIIERRNLK